MSKSLFILPFIFFFLIGCSSPSPEQDTPAEVPATENQNDPPQDEEEAYRNKIHEEFDPAYREIMYATRAVSNLNGKAGIMENPGF